MTVAITGPASATYITISTGQTWTRSATGRVAGRIVSIVRTDCLDRLGAIIVVRAATTFNRAIAGSRRIGVCSICTCRITATVPLGHCASRRRRAINLAARP